MENKVKVFIDNVILPKLVKMGIDGTLPLDMSQLSSEYFVGEEVTIDGLISSEENERLKVELEKYKNGYDENWIEIERLKAELEKYKNGYDELMCYWDSIGDEEKPLLHKRLQKLGL